MTAARREFLTVEQTAAVCGIGRTSAYQLARRAADHGEGDFPAVRFGKQLRVPRKKLEALIGGPITLPTDPPAAPPPTSPPSTNGSGSSVARAATPKRSAPSSTAAQPSLPFTTP
ncbi:MAG: helix-turn-helix transcriptional regulator [Planctomycetota bacterium]